MDYQPPPFFSRGPAPLVRLGFFACLAVLLMVLDARFRYAESLRQVIALLAYPLQRVALVPGEMFGGAAGQVTRVYPLLSEVTLITDKEQRTPVQVVRNGLRAIIYGGGDRGTLDLSYTAANADVLADDVLVTSGIDGTYPAGLPVAKVARIERDAAYSFAKITCIPTAGTDQNRQVLVLSQEANLPAVPVETEPAPDKGPKQPKRAKKRE